MIRKIFALLALIIAVSAGVFAITNNTKNNEKSNKVQVAASFYPLADFAKNVGGEYVSVQNVTPAGAEPHDYEPAARDLADISSSDVFIYNGGAFEPWTEKFVRSYKHTSIEASDGITLHEAHEEEEPGHEQSEHEHGSADPHFWLDPILAQKIVANIRDGLVKADPAHADDYRKNANEYQAKLAKLDAAYKDGLAHCSIDTVIASHGAFGYIAERYHFTADAITGISPEEEPSAQKMAELATLAHEKNIKYIFFEHLVSPRLADTIAQEVGAKTLVFDPIEGLTKEDQDKGKNYISIQYENLQAIRTARACR